ncbi:MAG: tetratricopeptide repeat protein [Chlorobi bacterium]|nr:tetratricopeptide repeat protein [Chlorobiota bacterium]
MKKALFILMTLLVGFSVTAQKKEVKAAEKALKAGDLKTALAKIDEACKLKDNADAKTKARIYYTKAKIYTELAKNDPSYYEKAVNMYEKLIAFEKENGLKKYTPQARQELMAISQQLVQLADKAHRQKDYVTAAKYYDLYVRINPDDDGKYILAIIQSFAGEDLLKKGKEKEAREMFEKAYANYRELYDKNYTGVRTRYLLTNKETGEEIELSNEQQWKILQKDPKFINPRKEKTENKRPELIANMLYVLSKMGRDEEAYQLIQKAKAEQPNNVDLLIAEANYYQKKGDTKKFAEAMAKAVELDPQPDYAYNAAIGYLNLKDYEKARKYFNKTIQIDPNYKNAYFGLALVELAGEEELIKELDANLYNDRKYRELKAKQHEMYRRAIPYLEKYYQLDPNDKEAVRMLKLMYLELEMMDKANEMKKKLKELKAKEGAK